MNFSKTILLLPLLLLGACVPRAPLPVNPLITQTPPKEAPSAAPTLEAARQSSAQAEIHNAVAADRVAAATAKVTASQVAVKALSVEVDRLVKQKTASENELVLVYNQLIAQEESTANTMLDLKAAKTELDAEKAMRNQLNFQLSAATSQANAKDAEAGELRARLLLSQEVAASYQKAAVDNSKLVASESARADKAQGVSTFKTKIIIGMAVLLLLAGAAVALLIRGKIPI